MKPILEWDEEYVLNLPPGEHDWVEFKSAEKLDFSLPGVNRNAVLSELSKQLSAFANTGGGTIVYGIEDAPVGATRKVDKYGGISLNLTKNGAKDWLEDVIPNLVDLPLSRFNVYPILKSESRSGIANGKALIMIEIPSSDAAPHQANDNKYYARVSGKSRPIGHRLVLDIMGRAKHPKMEMEFSFSRRDDERHRLFPTLNCYCRNIGRVYANYVNAFISIPVAMTKHFESRGYAVTIEGKAYRQYVAENIRKDYVGSTSGMYPAPMYVTRFDPVLPELRFYKAIDINIDPLSDEMKALNEEWIYWTIYADNAPHVERRTRIREIKIE